MRHGATDYWRTEFQAMASPCEILLHKNTQSDRTRLFKIAQDEALRIEKKFSRYRCDNIVHTINHALGHTTEVDEETGRILDYANTCYQLSDGLFDITSGLLRKLWNFSSANPTFPKAHEVAELLPLIGWDKVSWQTPFITLQAGMEIDLGGIGKEYAADRIHDLLQQSTEHAFLINLGGDIRCGNPQQNYFWNIGIEDPAHTSTPSGLISINHGAIATSGDTHRFIELDGKRVGHILNPKTGYPIENAPRSVTVRGANCTEAGMLATFAMLQGINAEKFLEQQRVEFWIIR